MPIRFLIATALALFTTIAQAAGPDYPGYYSADFYRNYDQLKNENMIRALNLVLKSGHIPQPNGYDLLVSSCQAQAGCKMHTGIGYTEARKAMFGDFDLQKLSGGVYAVKEVYCERTVTSKEANSIGPGLIPEVKFMNAEHTWPQSRFTSRYSKDMQKCDMHNLFPTDAEMNSHRSSLRFGNVLEDTEELKCDLSHLGHSASGEIVFEPPPEHKGNVARAIFYFAARYEMKINDQEETTLREWNDEDPVDEAEVLRAERIYELQHTRNPFIDLPDLLEKIENF